MKPEELFAKKPLPERVHAIAVHRRFARRIATGEKLWEVRGRPWPYPPGWLAIYASKKLGDWDDGETFLAAEDCPSQAITCVVWVDGSRPMVKGDERAACIRFENAKRYAPEPHVWALCDRVQLETPIALADTGWAAAPQNIVTIGRERIVDALGLFQCDRCPRIVVLHAEGTDNDMPGVCDECWGKTEREKGRT